ncbi:MAG: cation-efflux pump [Chlorobiaceae bacterium]|nr:cation-efflux pump [Chlorobiaceae bacterium]MBA4309744.1 cation-efflux pump [Chlorobiaceae bacterium]
MNNKPLEIKQMAKRGMNISILGIIVNALLAIIKGVTGVVGNSYALIADAIESLFDVFSSIIVWIGLRISTIPPDEDHPYGHGKAEPIAAIVVAIALLGAAFGIAYQSIQEILTPHHAPASFTLIVLVVVIIVKEVLFRTVLKVAKDVDSTAVKNDAWHHRSDAITSAFAFVGISIALIGGDGYEMADDYAALCASVVIVFNAVKLLLSAVNEVMDIAPSSEIEKLIRDTAINVEGVVELDKCKIRKTGLFYFVDLHVVVDGNISVKEGHYISHLVKDEIMKTEPKVFDVIIHIEPDIY